MPAGFGSPLARPGPVRLVFTPPGWEDYTYWLAADRATLKRINRLTDDACAIPRPGPASQYHCGTCWPRAVSPQPGIPSHGQKSLRP
jgi:toxin YoeB